MFRALLLILSSLLTIVWFWIAFKAARAYIWEPRLVESVDCVNEKPKVSVIIPIRNEEERLSDCLDSLLNQDYPNLEVILVDDESSDNTPYIAESYRLKDRRIKVLHSERLPEGWVGKNRACHRGYEASKGEVLLFMDADTKIKPWVISSAVNCLLHEKLDALTLSPRIECRDLWAKIMQPLINLIFRALLAPLTNDQKSRFGYVNGCFFLICRQVYEDVGGHKRVKDQILEDVSFGLLLKSEGFRVRMFRGEDAALTLWSRDLSTLWSGLVREMTPIIIGHRGWALSLSLGAFAIFLLPFLLPIIHLYGEPIDFTSPIILSACSMMVILEGVEAQRGLGINPIYSVAPPLASFILVSATIASAYRSVWGGGIDWRGRRYRLGSKTSVASVKA